jgi:hypothetical protein
MPKRLLRALTVLVVSSSPLAAETMSIEHAAVGCVVAEKFPRLEARFVPATAVGKARVFFQTTDAKRWYSVAMKPDSSAFSGVLPKPKKSLDAFRYYIEVTDTSLSTSRTAEFTTSVVDGPGGCKGKVMGGGVASAAVTLEVPAGAPAVPAGFSSSGLTAAGVAGAAGAAAAVTGAAVAGAAAGGGISTGVIVAVAGVAAAGAGVAVAVSKGGEDSGPTRTTYAGTFSQAWQRSQTTRSSTGSTTCVFDNVLSGTVSVTLESGGTANSTAQITIAEAETGRTAGSLCTGGTPGPPAGGTYPVAVNGSSVAFKVPNNNPSSFSVPYDFDGVLSGNVIMGKMAFTAVGSSPGSGSFGNIVTQFGRRRSPSACAEAVAIDRRDLT